MVEHLIPKTYKEALEAIHLNKYIKVAGGTDLMVQKRSSMGIAPNFEQPAIFLFNLEDLKYVYVKSDVLHIGSMTSMETLLNHPLVPKAFKEVLLDIASPGIRSLATLAGNIANASPAADTLVYLYAARAKVCLEKLGHQRILPIEAVVIGPKKTIIESDEVIKEILIPLETWNDYLWIKVGGRKSDAISKASIMGLAKIKSGIIKDLRIALGAVYPTVLTDHAYLDGFTGMAVNDLISQKNDIIAHYLSLITPIDDQRSNKMYRKQVVSNMMDAFVLKLIEGVGI
jgi:xanthine dehydrogenase FAD-binding subunit